jgi:hypothetical protein
MLEQLLLGGIGVDSCSKERIPPVSEAADHTFQKYVTWPFKEETP